MISIKLLMKYFLVFTVLNLFAGCKAGNSEPVFSDSLNQDTSEIRVGAESMNDYIHLLHKKTIGLVVNQTSVIGGVHLVDTLLAQHISIKAVFAPEHGYKGKVERGQDIDNSRDENLGIPVISIYGNKRKPSAQDLSGIDYLIFDMQDVGVRFYTYISTLHYVMEACAENNVRLIVLDRPNPLGYYIDGPVLDTAYRSFIGMHPVPVVYGMTIGEYALMINGEGWLSNKVKCDLLVVPVKNYNHQTRYILPVPPSPNLPDMKSVYLYPSICFFEGTEVNEGRGTDTPFQVFGNPEFKKGSYSYTPVSKPGFSLHPRFEGQVCYGYDLSSVPIEKLQSIKRLELKYLIDFYNQSSAKPEFFHADFFDLLAGSNRLRDQITGGMSVDEIRSSWKQDIENFSGIRQKYLLYK